jgi:hypothetical protein
MVGSVGKRAEEECFWCARPFLASRMHGKAPWGHSSNIRGILKGGTGLLVISLLHEIRRGSLPVCLFYLTYDGPPPVEFLQIMELCKDHEQ